MIGYRVKQAELEALIEAYAPGWVQRAATRTAGFRQKSRYLEPSSIWSKVKPVYMQLQGGSKCAYCERKLESVDFGKGEQDVEHFRPKGRVRPWKAPKALSNQGVVFAPTPLDDYGYYLLRYHPLNYSAACKPCNSALKRDHFPIAGTYDLMGDDPARMTQEKPFLICPIGDFDDGPEVLIRFHGVSPQAVATRGYRQHRALVTIEFFKLDNEAKRKNLIRERAVILIALFPQLEKLADGVTGLARREAEEVVDGFTSPNAPHTNCARSYKDLFHRNRAEAKAVFDAALKLIMSIS